MPRRSRPGGVAEEELQGEAKGHDPDPPPGAQPDGPRGRERPAHLRAVEPSPRRVDREEVPGLRAPAARPHPGGQPRPHARRREVRLAQGLQVLDLRRPGGSARRSPAASPNTGRTIRLPVHAGDTLARVQKAQARLELKLGRPATLAELGAEVELPEDKLIEALRFRAEPLSLSEPLREDGDAELGDVVEDRSAESPFEVAATALLPARDQPAARTARRARARDPAAPLRPGPRRAPHARGGRRALQPHPRAHPPDRGPGDVEAPAPLERHRARATSSPSERPAGRVVGLQSPPPARAGGDRRYDHAMAKKLLIIVILVALGAIAAKRLRGD